MENKEMLINHDMDLNEVLETLKGMNLPNTMMVNDLIGVLEDVLKQKKYTEFEERLVWNNIRLLEEYLGDDIIDYGDEDEDEDE